MDTQGKIAVITGAGSGIGRATAKPPQDMPLLEPEGVADGVVQLIADDSLAGRVLLTGPGFRDVAPLPPLPIN